MEAIQIVNFIYLMIIYCIAALMMFCGVITIVIRILNKRDKGR